MPRSISIHLAAMHRQIRRIERSSVFGTVVVLLCSPVLLSTPRTGWLSLVLVLVLAGYLRRKVLRVVWARRAMRQLRLEEQFVRHGPAPAQALTCMRRPNHLWTRSLTLKGLKTLRADPSVCPSPEGAAPEHLLQHYNRSFAALSPSRLPVDLVWLAGGLLLWLWFVPEATLAEAPLLLLLGAGLLLLVLAAEAVQAVLEADLRAGFEQFAGLLAAWTRTASFDDILLTDAARYRHTPLYHSPASARPTAEAGRQISNSKSQFPNPK